jgi:hypothetical protein
MKKLPGADGKMSKTASVVLRLTETFKQEGFSGRLTR